MWRIVSADTENLATELPERVDARRLAATGGGVTGVVALAGMTRLSAHLAATPSGDGVARVVLHFAEDCQRRVTVTGCVQARLTLQCQRCLRLLSWPVDAAVRVMAVDNDEAAAQLPREWEPVLVGKAGLDPAALAEDELILALPAVARCDNADCAGPVEAPAGAGRRKPFAVALADWPRGD